MNTPINSILSPLLHIDEVLAMTTTIGLHITRLSDTEVGNLYVWCRPDGGIVYIGKSEGAHRLSNERSWVEEARSQIDHRTWAAFSVVMLRQQAVPIPLYYDPEKSDLNKAKDLVKEEEWSGAMVEQLLEYRDSLTVAEVEKILIRMPLATGRFTANSAGTGIWNNRLYCLWDYLAQFAAIECGYREFSVAETPEGHGLIA